MRDSHRKFLQAFMSKGLLDAKDVKQLFKIVGQCHAADVEEERKRLAEFVITINNAIKPFHMEIKKGVSEDTGSNFYCLVNNTDNGITRLASDYSPNEMELFKKIVECIVESETGRVSSIEALNLTEQLGKKMTKDAAQDMLQRLIDNNWITLTGGQYSLATRAILELEQYIKEQYPNLFTLCNLCEKLCLQGHICDNCGIKLHRACAAKLSRQKDAKCPGTNCNASWDSFSKQVEPNTQVEPTPTQGRKRKARN